MFISGEHLNQSCFDAAISQMRYKLPASALATGPVNLCQLIYPLKKVHDGLCGKPTTLSTEKQCNCSFVEINWVLFGNLTNCRLALVFTKTVQLSDPFI